eukprot:gene16597-18286_t
MATDAQSNFLNFRQSLLIQPNNRNPQDIELIYRHLREMQANSQLPEPTVKAMAKSARYEFHNSNVLLYTAEDWSTCWYILLSGSVFLDRCMYLPGSSFGKQSVKGKRSFDCLILENSEMIVIDYPNEQLFKPFQRKSYSMQDLEKLLALDAEEVQYKQVKEGQPNQDKQPMKEKMRASDQYLDRRMSETNEPANDFLSGLKETMVDAAESDDEDDISTASESTAVRDIVRDCLEKDPSERTESDINILMDFVQHLPAFSKVSHNVRHEMCAVMVFAVVETAGSEVMNDGEEMDSWSVILNGSVEVTFATGGSTTMHLGDAFGVKTEPETIFHKGVMRTRVDDCQFVCIAREDYWRIFSQGEADTKKVEEEGEVVLVTEHRTTDGGSREGQVVIRGQSDRLLDHLMEDHSMIDPTYVEDYLLTCVVFQNKPHDLAAKLIRWFDRGQLKDKVTRVMLLWVNNHYSDFESDHFMEGTLERFEFLLEAKKMLGQLKLLSMARSSKAKTRIITLEKPSRDSRLEFSLSGGAEHGQGIFVSKIDYGSKSLNVGLKKGDQILELNGQSFENITMQKALDALMTHSHLSLTVKHNYMAYKQFCEYLQKSKHADKNHVSRNEPNRGKLPAVARSTSDSCERPKLPPGNKKSATLQKGNHLQYQNPPLNVTEMHASGTYPGRQNAKLKKAMMKLSILPKSGSNQELDKLHENEIFNSNFSLKSMDADSNELQFSDDCQVIKVHRSLDQTSKYFVINKETTAQEIVIASVEQFGITDTKGKPLFLCEVTVTEDGVIRQKRLPNIANDLANRISLSSRYFIKNTLSDGGIPDDVAQEIAKEGVTTFLQLSPSDLARELTLQDFDLFRSIDSREYIYNIFDSKNPEKFVNLGRFEETTNTEMFWVMREVCSEINVVKRVKIIKRFIKIAKLCNDFKNYNSMFALLSGLDHSSVTRLKGTWDKVPAKYTKLFEDLKMLMDPSRNMSKYRNLFSGERAYPPLIPFFPIVKKDLTFLHLGNETYVDGLVNFEKLRMIAKEVRKVCKYCAIGYDPGKMDNLSSTSSNAPPSIAQSVVSVITGQNTISRKNRRIVAGMEKKIYEETLGNRRMRQYLENLSTIHVTEDDIYRMSKSCEGPQGSQTLPGRRKIASPLPTTHKKSETIARTQTQTTPAPSILSSDTTSVTSRSSTLPGPLHASPRGPKKFPDVRQPEENRYAAKNTDKSSSLPNTSSNNKDTEYRYQTYPEFLDNEDCDGMEGQVSVV